MESYRTILSTAVLLAILLMAVACKTESNLKKKSNTIANGANEKDSLSITVLQTADIHGQLHRHPELFWEDEEIVFKTVAAWPTSRPFSMGNFKRIPIERSWSIAVT